MKALPVLIGLTGLLMGLTFSNCNIGVGVLVGVVTCGLTAWLQYKKTI